MRLIDVDKIKLDYSGLAYIYPQDCKGTAKYFLDQIKLIPTVDAEPVRHGHWIIHADELFPADSTQECSVCHGEEWLGIKNDNYCPNCGAKMDEVKE